MRRCYLELRKEIEKVMVSRGRALAATKFQVEKER